MSASDISAMWRYDFDTTAASTASATVGPQVNGA